jgi:hypothetical protein
MNRAVAVVLAFIWAVLPSVCAANAAEVGSAVSGASDSEASGFYCDRTALTPEQKLELRAHGRVLRDAVLSARELDNGFEFEFKRSPATYRALVGYLPLEHACCPFFDFGVRMGRNAGTLSWSLTGSLGVKEFIKEELSWLFDRLQQA